MPLATPQIKVGATRGFGAEVFLHGANYDEACEEARIRREESRTFIHPFDEAGDHSGQGVIGLELLQQVPGLKPSSAYRRRRAYRRDCLRSQRHEPAIRVIGVEPEKLQSTLRPGRPVGRSQFRPRPPSPTASPCAAPVT